MGLIYKEVSRWASEHPNKIAVVWDEVKNITYAELIRAINRRANRLIELGVSNGDGKSCIAIAYKDEYEQLITVLAANACNLFIAPINSELKSEQVEAAVKHLGARYLLCDKNLLSGVTLALNVIECTIDGDVQFADAYLQDRNPNEAYENFLVTLSSGSTGIPKPIVFGEDTKLMRFQHAKNTYGLGSEDVVLCASPFHHSLGQRLTLLPLLLGGTLVILSRFTKEKWFKNVSNHGVTFTIAVSSHLNALSEFFFDFLSSQRTLKKLVSSSAFISTEVKNKFFNLPNFSFYEMYGASEVGTATNLTCLDPVEKWGSVGKPCEKIDIKIVDSDRVVDSGVVGEIWVKSYGACRGYLNNALLTTQSFRDKFFTTGDLGYFDKDGYLYFVDRKKDLIISGGSNIYPSDVEAVINEVEGVIQSCVIGLDDEYLIEVPVAYVIASDTSIINIEAVIRSRVREKLAPFQRPHKYIFCTSFPMGSSGKLDKKRLRIDANNLIGRGLSKKFLALKKR
jgi:acyl-CoA synthetase (AMP-forming)/AMP-acid ligase II